MILASLSATLTFYFFSLGATTILSPMQKIPECTVPRIKNYKAVKCSVWASSSWLRNKQSKSGERSNPAKCCGCKSQGYPCWKIDPGNIKAETLDYLVSYFENFAPSLYTVSVLPVIFKADIAGPLGM